LTSGARARQNTGGNEKTFNYKERVGSMKKWHRPVIQEIRVGMEINLYVCAEL